ncbi:MAG: hypothetical protein JWO24_2599, partial [Rhodospirillales bacterium]|nr:hypothetical protein [Rhodospirillales bacterium]
VFSAMTAGDLTLEIILAAGGEYWRLEEARGHLPRAEA